MANALDVRVLGELEVRHDGVPVALPQSKKTRALLAFLATQQSPQRRESLCELLWELPDDPRGALRWSLSKLRGVLNRGEVEVLTADRERVYFNHDAAAIDITRLQRLCAGGVDQLTTSALRDALMLFRGPFIEGLELPGQPAFETWRLGQQEQTRRLHLHVLEELSNRIAIGTDEFVALTRRRVELDPGNEHAHAGLIAALSRRGAADEAHKQVQASVRMLSDIGPFDEKPLLEALTGVAAPLPQSSPIDEAAPLLRQDIRYCTSRDGVRIAFAKVGSGPPLLKTANWLNHLEFDWESPVWRHLFRAITADFTLIRYDSRGNGLSDWDAVEFSLDAFVEDLASVADAAGLDRFPLLAISQGCPVAVEFAVRYPERVSKLILYGGYAQGWRWRSDPDFRAQQEALVTLTRTGWGRDNPAYRQLFTSFFIPDATAEQMDWFNELQRRTTSPENAANLLSAFADLNVLDRLPEVRVPTLVIHTRGDARIPYGNGRQLAMGIPGARFVTLDSKNHLVLEQEPAWPRFMSEIRSFLSE